MSELIDFWCETHSMKEISQRIASLEESKEKADDLLRAIMSEEDSYDTESEALGRILLSVNNYFGH